MKNDLMLVIDMQNVYSRGQEWECSNFDTALYNIKKLLDATKAYANVTTAFTKYIADKDPVGTWRQYNIENEAVNNDEYKNEIVNDLKGYITDDNLYTKSKYSSLAIKAIKDMAIRTIDNGCVVVTGVVAECCVLFTVTELIDLGVKVIYLEDAVAGIDEDTEKAVIKVLSGLSPLHVEVMSTEKYLEGLDNQSYIK